MITWLSLKQCASLLSIGERGMRKAKSKYQYRYIDGVGGNSGKVLQFALESLSEDAQARYRGEEKEFKDILHFTGKQRDEANEKAWIVEQYHQSGLSPNTFVYKFNAENPPEDAITKSKLFRWQRKYKNREVFDLIDQRGGHNLGKDTIPEDAWDCFYALFMTQQKRSIQLCYDVTQMEYPNIPSVQAFRRKVKTINPYSLLYYREGNKAFNDALPSMERSRQDIASNDIWFSDHHRVDVFVKSADGKYVFRPWLTAFYDARSNKPVSFIAREADPDATVVKQCFRIGVEKHGIPNECYFDNGKDYRSKNFSRDYSQSLVNKIGIGIIYATPYHGAAKTIERFFGTFTDRFSRRFNTYTGCNAKIRPECMRVSDEEIIAQAPSLEEYNKLLANYIEEYCNTPSKGIDMNGNSPNQVYSENLKVKKVIRDLDALRLLCGNSEERVVHKNGVSIKNNTFHHDLLAEHLGERVIVTYDPANIDKMAIFDMNNRAICTATAKIRTPFRNTSEEQYKKAAREKRAVRARVKKDAPKRDMDIHQIIARNQLMEKAFAETGDTSVVEQISPQAARNAQILKETDLSTHSRRISGEESISESLLKVYQKQA
jgi:hypothetical protein